MTPDDFKKWRKDLKLSQKEAAEALGLKRRVVQYYEKGERDGEPVEIPKTVRLACYALAQGIQDYHNMDQEGGKLLKKDDKSEKAKKKSHTDTTHNNG